MIGSDLVRTNYYNATDGTDHCPIGSFVVTENCQRWTNRAVGGTNHPQFARKMNPLTLQADEYGPLSTIIYLKHVHKGLRRYLGISDSPRSLRLPFNNVEDFAFLDQPVRVNHRDYVVLTF